jgi:hypothetical protein
MDKINQRLEHYFPHNVKFVDNKVGLMTTTRDIAE